MIFNPGQEKIIQDGVYTVRHGSKQVFEFMGEAGTGKSVVLAEIPRRLGYDQDEVLPMAFTGQAAIVMRTKGFTNARTVCSGLFEPAREDFVSADAFATEVFNRPNSKLAFKKKVLDPKIKCMVLDEAANIPLRYRADILSYGLPIIAAGDPGQLPPVQDAPAFLFDSCIPTLNEIMRQKQGDGITYLAYRARRNLPISCGRYNNVLVIEEKDLTDDMLKYANVVLAYTNKKKEELNKYVRNNVLGIIRDVPVYGERLICRKNNWNLDASGINLVNGLSGMVSSMPDVSSFTGETFFIDFNPDISGCCFYNIPCDYKYFIAPPEMKEQIRKSKLAKYSKGELFDFAYAQTVHLAQGSEYDHGTYFEEWCSPDMKAHLDYTAITRFRNAAIWVKPTRKNYVQGYNITGIN